MKNTAEAEATTLRGPNFTVDVLNSARPDAPKFLYALPLFEWDTPSGTNGITERTRLGGGLRIYLDHGWNSSGNGELLGIVFQDNKEFLALDDSLKPLVTQWGADLIWDANPAPVSAQKAHFKNTKLIPDKPPTLVEYPKDIFSVAGYEAVLDPDHKLWRVDIRIDTGDSYWPFVRLALARFQPQSIDDAHLSRVFRSDFIQFPPTRHTKIMAVSASSIHVTVNGPVYFDSELIRTVWDDLSAFGGPPGSNGLSEIKAVIERCDPTDDLTNELAWKPIDATRVLFFQNPSAPGKWEGGVTLNGTLGSGFFRLTIKEFEWFRTDDASPLRPARDQIRVVRRVVFADVFAL